MSLGGHAVKMIGWGVDNGVPYWLVANSWNTDWAENGNKNDLIYFWNQEKNTHLIKFIVHILGFFRILRGKDECGIESGVVAGLISLWKDE